MIMTGLLKENSSHINETFCSPLNLNLNYFMWIHLATKPRTACSVSDYLTVLSIPRS